MTAHNSIPILILALGAAWLAGCGHEAPKAAAPHPATARAQTMVVRSAPADIPYEASGQTASQFRAELSAKVMGRIEAIKVVVGDAVAPGQVLVSLESRDLAAGVASASSAIRAAEAGVRAAEVAAKMETSASAARIREAESRLAAARAGLAAAQARYDLALAGPRTQERAQADIAVAQAQANLTLAKSEMDRAQRLLDAGAISQRQYDQAQNGLQQAKAAYDAAVQGQKIALEGTRAEDLRAAKEGVSQAQAAVRQAEAGVASAIAAGDQVEMRRREVELAQAQRGQASAGAAQASANLSYATIASPFEGRVVSRMADPGDMASPGMPLLVVEGGAPRFVATLPERWVGRVQLGQVVKVRIDALEGERDAKIVEITPASEAGAHRFRIEAELFGDEKPASGLFGRLLVPVDRRPAILIPQSATWEREGLRYVFALNADGVARLRIVTLGKVIGDQVDVLSGLNDGDRIVVGNRAGVQDGDRVEAN